MRLVYIGSLVWALTHGAWLRRNGRASDYSDIDEKLFSDLQTQHSLGYINIV